MTVEEAAGPPVEIWPDNVDAVNVFIDMSTQWRVGVAGATGLDYGVIEKVMQLGGIRKKHRREVFEAVRIMESAAIRFRQTEKDE